MLVDWYPSPDPDPKIAAASRCVCTRLLCKKKNGGFTKEDPNGMFVQGGRMGGEEGRGSKNHVRYEKKIRLRVRFSTSREFDK